MMSTRYVPSTPTADWFRGIWAIRGARLFLALVILIGVTLAIALTFHMGGQIHVDATGNSWT